MYFTISMYLFACIALHVIGSRYQVGNSGGGTAAAAERSSGICGRWAVYVAVRCMWRWEGGVLLVWWCVMV